MSQIVSGELSCGPIFMIKSRLPVHSLLPSVGFLGTFNSDLVYVIIGLFISINLTINLNDSTASNDFLTPSPIRRVLLYL